MFVFYYFRRHDFKHFSATSNWYHNFNLELSFETQPSLQKVYEPLNCNFCIIYNERDFEKQNL